jgi:gas vesicle structural protein
MVLERTAAQRLAAEISMVDVLDRVLDKGVVIDAFLRVSFIGIDLVNVEARIVVAYVETYLRTSEAIASTGLVARPLATTINPHIAATSFDLEQVMAEKAELKRMLEQE